MAAGEQRRLKRRAELAAKREVRGYPLNHGVTHTQAYIIYIFHMYRGAHRGTCPKGCTGA
jgi:hypothetical protein